jgi:ornithine carbamoyltransferase
MAVDLRGKDLLKLLDYTPDEIRYLIESAKHFKQLKKTKTAHNYLVGKNIALIFEKDSTRTRCAFEVAASDLGMGSTYLGPTGSQIGKKETIADTARVLSRMYDGIQYRGFKQAVVEELAKYSSVPVWNGLTDEFHPTQMLADFLTIEENFGDVKGKKLVFVGDTRNNVASSLMVASAKLGVHFVACGPRELWPSQQLVETCNKISSENESTINVTDNLDEAVASADVIYTDVWLSMGEDESKWSDRIKLLKNYQVSSAVMQKAKQTAIFLHALPSFHNFDTAISAEIFERFSIKEMEVTDEVFESPQSKVFDQAENRLHTIKALIFETLRP